MSEILQLRGRLATNDKVIASLKTGIDVDIDEARTLFDKYTEKPELQTDRMLIVTDRINESVNKLRKLMEQNKQIRKDLGE